VIYYYLEVTQFKSILKQANDTPFMADRLGRYGYLPNPKSEEPGLPVGFSVAQENSHKIIGMTYTACHIRQIDVSDTAYRIDGGPAITDMQSFISDLDTAVKTVRPQRLHRVCTCHTRLK
jgi:hypothetical protein